jgi:hypothetical protein
MHAGFRLRVQVEIGDLAIRKTAKKGLDCHLVKTGVLYWISFDTLPYEGVRTLEN